MIKELQLRILPEEAVNEQSLRQVVARETGEAPKNIRAVRVLKRSIDARQRTIFVNVKLRVFMNEMPSELEYQSIEYKDVSAGKPVIVVGAGPGGLFAALRLIELGLRPIIVERGKDVRERKKDIALISREHKVNGESNYSFGEGGAGAYSDGKLYTRSKKRGSVDKILNIFCQFGASPSILADAHPHIGTDKLPRVIENIREQIKRCGGEVHFETRMDAFIMKENEVMTEVTTLSQLEEPEVKQEEFKKVEPVAPPPALKSSIKFTAPVIKKDEEVRDDEEIKSQEELTQTKVAISIADVKGNDELNGKDIAELKEVITKAPEAEEKTYTMVEQMPQFPGGDRELLSFIAKNLHYPTIAQEKGIQGKVFVRFVVSATGDVKDVKVMRSLDPYCDKEAIRVIQSLPKWIPGRQNGRNVPVYYTVPITFKLQ